MSRSQRRIDSLMRQACATRPHKQIRASHKPIPLPEAMGVFGRGSRCGEGDLTAGHLPGGLPGLPPLGRRRHRCRQLDGDATPGRPIGACGPPHGRKHRHRRCEGLSSATAPRLNRFREMSMDQRWVLGHAATMHGTFPGFMGRVRSVARGPCCHYRRVPSPSSRASAYSFTLSARTCRTASVRCGCSRPRRPSETRFNQSFARATAVASSRKASRSRTCRTDTCAAGRRCWEFRGS